jgi:hypothetical protein
MAQACWDAEGKMTTEIAEAQKLSGIFQTFTTGSAVAPDVQDKCNAYMDAFRKELSNNRLKYLDYGIAFRSRRREVVRNALSQYIVDVVFLVDANRKPLPYEVTVASIHAEYSAEKNEYAYVIEKEIGDRIGADALSKEAFAYLTGAVHVPVASSELIGMELRDLKAFIWFGDKKASEGRGLRDIVIQNARGAEDSSFGILGNVTVELARHLLRKREALRPL